MVKIVRHTEIRYDETIYARAITLVVKSGTREFQVLAHEFSATAYAKQLKEPREKIHDCHYATQEQPAAPARRSSNVTTF